MLICIDKNHPKILNILPKCWATSKISLDSLPCTSKALRIGGNPWSNCTSTTAPITATMWPEATLAAVLVVCVAASLAAAAACLFVTSVLTNRWPWKDR